LLKFSHLENLKDIRIGHIYAFIDDLHARGCKNRYANIFIDTFKVLGHFLKNKKLEKLTYLKEDHYIKATLDDLEIEQFLNIPPSKNTNKDNWALWKLFYSLMAFCGMRPGEVANLTPDCVDFGRGVFILEDTKINEPRYVPIPEHLKDDLRERISKIRHDGLVFCTVYGNKFNDGQWNYHFHTGIDKLGITRKNLTPYSLRHSFITRSLEEDINIFKVQKIVGHHDIRTTLVYTHMTTRDLIETLNKDRMVRKYLEPQKMLNTIEDFIDNLISGDKRIFYRKNKENGLLEISLRQSNDAI
jgi:integrase